MKCENAHDLSLLNLELTIDGNTSCYRYDNLDDFLKNCFSRIARYHILYTPKLAARLSKRSERLSVKMLTELVELDEKRHYYKMAFNSNGKIIIEIRGEYSARRLN
jgi:hypothetical protein